MSGTRLLLVALLLAAPFLGHNTLPATYKLEGSVFNAGGHPAQGTMLTSGSYRMTLDALGDATGAVSLASDAWRMDASLVTTYRPPGEVLNLRFEDAVTLRWDPEPSVGFYHLYQDAACLQPRLSQTTTTEPAVPAAAGDIYRYLVTASNPLGEEGTPGRGTGDAPRTLSNACP
jgi:hypothetical protein